MTEGLYYTTLLLSILSICSSVITIFINKKYLLLEVIFILLAFIFSIGALGTANLIIHSEIISSLLIFLIVFLALIIILFFIYFVNYFFKNIISWRKIR